MPPSLKEVVDLNVGRGLYDPEIVAMYSDEEWAEIGAMVDHGRDDLFRYAGAEQMTKKYLVQNRKTKQVYETFQFPYILVAAILFSKYPKDTRLNFVKRYYDLVSQHYVSLPTPIMAALRTNRKQFSSCTLIEAGDSLKSINAAASAIVDYASNKAGIGLNIGRIRAEGQLVRGGDAVTTGVLPFAKYFAAALKSCSQGAVRGASATFNYPVWHLEFPTLIELKNNKGTDETRLRTVDYCVHLNLVMYERLVNKGNITFFSPDEVPGLYEAFYSPDTDAFRALYEKYEADPDIRKLVKPAAEVFAKLLTERYDTGRIYILHADLVNKHGSLFESINMTNLCVEILQATIPMGREDSEIALCTLSAINVGKIETYDEMAEACELANRALDELLDYQDYPHPAAERHTMKYRPLGIGIIGFAHWLAKNGLRWGDAETPQKVSELVESMAYNLIHTSMVLAKEKGSCSVRTKYHDGIFPFDTYSEGQITTTLTLRPQWDALRENLKKYGIRNATNMSFMPSETSSQLANETNGMEPPKQLITTKGNKEVSATQVVPDYIKLNHLYQTVFEVRTRDYITVVGVFQKFIDQSISANTPYDPTKGAISTSQLIQDVMFAYKNGVKTLYYNVINDDEAVEEESCGGDGCKI
jgi:ribonucleoside-diphosphate reductase alpha chain